MNEEVRLGSAHRFVNAHATGLEIDPPPLPCRIATPQEPNVAAEPGRGAKSTVKRFAAQPVRVEAFERYTDEYFRAGRQPGQVDARRVIAHGGCTRPAHVTGSRNAGSTDHSTNKREGRSARLQTMARSAITSPICRPQAAIGRPGSRLVCPWASSVRSRPAMPETPSAACSMKRRREGWLDTIRPDWWRSTGLERVERLASRRKSRKPWNLGRVPRRDARAAKSGISTIDRAGWISPCDGCVALGATPKESAPDGLDVGPRCKILFDLFRVVSVGSHRSVIDGAPRRKTCESENSCEFLRHALRRRQRRLGEYGNEQR